MRILVINPNTSKDVTELIASEARRSALPETELIFETAPFGVEYIETRAESAIAGYAVACVAAERYGEYDGIVVAAFGDPGLLSLKELVDCPVVGITEAALASASLLGQRFSIIAISDRITAWYRETVERSHLSTRLGGIHSLKDPLKNIGTVQEDYPQKLKEMASESITNDGADVIILGGAPLAGMARNISGEIKVPVVDGVSSGICHCETLIRLESGKAVEGSFSRPPLKPNSKLPDKLAALLDRKL